MAQEFAFDLGEIVVIGGDVGGKESGQITGRAQYDE